jgi:uncharacterized RDD family membrane protein YckC
MEQLLTSLGYEPHLLPIIRVGFGRRFAAWFLDGMIVSTVVVVLFFTIGEKNLRFFDGIDGDSVELRLSDEEVNSDDASTELQEQLEERLGLSSGTLGILAGMNTVFMLLYSLIELASSASPAKRLLGIAIAHESGLQASRKLLAMRWLAKYGAYGLALIPGVALVSSLWSLVIFVGCLAALAAGKQALHDTIARSAVFHAKDVIAV